MGVKLGIDLGTNNVVVATMEGDKPIVCEFEEGYLVPSYVLLEDSLNPVIGEVAKEEWQSGNPNCYRRFKLDMGKDVTYPSGVTPEQLTQFLLAGIENYLLGDETTMSEIEEIEEVVVSVPHGWDPMRREATMNAISAAGLHLKALISEPVAAAAYYYYCRQKKEGSQKVLVCDMGGGTFDISLVEVIADTKITVIDSINNEKAGMWADAYLVQYFAREFNERFLLNIPCKDIESDILNTKDLNIREWLKEAEVVKETLNSRKIGLGQRKTIEVRPILSYGEHIVKLQITYDQMTELLAPLMEEGKATIQKLLGQNPKHQPDLVVLAGGMGKMLLVQEMVAQATGHPLEDLMGFGIEADRAIARGAALVAYDKIQIQERLLHSIGIAAEVREREKKSKLVNHIIVDKGTPIPFDKPVSTIGKYYFTTTKMNQEKIDLIVVYGDEENVEECEEAFEVDFKLPFPVEKGTPYDFWVEVDGNGVAKVGVEGKGVDGKVIFQGEILKKVRHYLQAEPIAQSDNHAVV